MSHRPLRLLVSIALCALALTSCAAGSTAEETAEASSDACRDIADASGATVCVPADPQRIVTLDPLLTLPTLISLDAPVVGSVTVYTDGLSFPDYLDDEDVAGIETVGSMQEVNVEAIAALEPDLIIGDVSTAEAYADQLAEIAPVVTTAYSFYNSDWLDDLRFVADVVGRTDDAEEQIAEYDEHAAEVAEALAEQGGGQTLSRVDIYDGTPLYYRSGCTWFGSVLADAGVSQPAEQQPDECTNGDASTVVAYLSLEELSVLDADAIVTYQQQASGSDVGANPLDELVGNTLWDALPAVQNDAVHVLGDAWGLGVSLEAANTILDDLVTIFPAS